MNEFEKAGEYCLSLPDVGELHWQQGPIRPGCGAYVHDVQRILLCRNGNEYDLFAHVPSPWTIEIGHPKGSVSASKKEIWLSYPNTTVQWLASAFHEFGHVQDFLREDFDLEAHEWVYFTFCAPSWYKPSLSGLKEVLDTECRAWDFAISQCRDTLTLPDERMQEIYQHIRSPQCVEFYLQKMFTVCLGYLENVDPAQARNILQQTVDEWFAYHTK